MKIFKFVNNSNNCYINSVLQILLKLYDFNKQILKYNEVINDKNTILYQYSCILKLYFNLNIEDETLLNPHTFYKIIHKKLNFKNKQQDINEFILKLFDTLEKEIQIHFPKFNINSFFDINNNYKIICNHCKHQIIKK